MSQTAQTSPRRPASSATGAPGIRRGMWIGFALVVVAFAIPAIPGVDVHMRYFPPLHAIWDPRVGPGTLPAILVAAAAGVWAVPLATRLGWKRLLGVVWVAGVVWMLALAFVDGSSGVGHILNTQYEYLDTARSVGDIPHMLDGFIDRIPYSDHDWPVHVVGHPPGALLFFVLLVRVGLGSGFAAGMVVTLVAATTAVAVLVTAARLGVGEQARLAAPLLVFTPAAIWQSVSGDAVFAAVAAWGMAALAYAATSRGLAMAGWSVLSGLLLGYCVMLSYGLPLLGLLAVAILAIARNWRPMPIAGLAALAVVLAFVPFGYSWWEALPVVVERSYAGVQHTRPLKFWIWANFAVLLLSAGPLLAGALAAARREVVAAVRRPTRNPFATLCAGGVGMVLVADLSVLSKGEVERIWLPFVPWVLLTTAFLPEGWRRRGLVLQVVFALVVQHLLDTGW